MTKLFKYLKPKIWLVLLVFVLIAAQSFTQLMLPDYMGKITAVVTGKVVVDNPSKQIWLYGGEMLIIAIVTILIALATSLSVSYLGAYFGKTVRGEVFKKVLSFSVGDYDKFGTASLMTRTTNDIEQIQTVLIMGLRIMVMSPVILIIAIIRVLASDAKLALILVVTIPLILTVIVVLFVFATPLFKKIQVALDNVTKVLRESLTGVRVIRAFNQEEKERKRFTKVNAYLTNTIIKVGRTMSFANPIISIIFDLSFFGVFLFGFILINNTTGAYDLENILKVAMYSKHIMMAFLSFSMLLIMIPRASVSAQRVNDILNTENIMLHTETPLLANCDLCGYVKFDNVTFTFPDSNTPTLKNISFEAKPGQVTAIIGSTGSGKSSIINLIPRFYDVTEGAVYVDGIDVRDYSQFDLREKIGFVPQQALLFSGTIRDNLLFGSKTATDDQLVEALKIAQASRFVFRKEEGLDLYVSQGGKNFSGGQKQRLSIARALVKRPEIYVFDDSFSALDFKTDIRLRTALKDYTKNSAVIIVAQRVSSIMDADNIVVLNEGKVVGQGTHEHLLVKCKVYKEIVFSQMDESEIKRTLELKEQVLLSEGGENNV